MSEDYEFGDDDPADRYCAEGEADPEAVSHRVQDIKQWLELAADREIPGWDELEPDEQAQLIAIGEDWLREVTGNGDHSVQSVAIAAHEARAAVEGALLWNELESEEQAVAIVFADSLVTWLVAEGSL